MSPEGTAVRNRVRIGVLGASGYTGAELLRFLAVHPAAEIAFLTADRQAGQPMAKVFPHLSPMNLPDLVRMEDSDWSQADVIFCALPHGTTQEVVSKLMAEQPDKKVIDLSADFRLFDVATYAEWYGHEHRAPDLQKEAVYGLTEMYRDDLVKARLCANPGCYTTSAELALMPLLEAGLIDPDEIVIDAVSGVTGAGRAEKLGSLHAEVSEGVHAYGVGSHRHMPEIEQELSRAAGKPIVASFTPHLVPMNRGILSTCYVKLTGAESPDDLRECLTGRYAEEPFVQVRPAGMGPATREVRGSNYCALGVFPDRRKGRAIVLSAIDNLVKGASGQAIQNMNVMLGLPETTGLEQMAVFP